MNLEPVPTALPALETPQVIDDDEADVEGALAGDADDPAIWLHPDDSNQSLVLTTLKDGGLAVFDLEGRVLQTVPPAPFGKIRYNNVDLIYGFKLRGRRVDLAVASDRQNDTLAIYRIDPKARRLADVTSPHIPASIFGIDDGEVTAYGLATYTSPESGKRYAFVTQADGNGIAQLELMERDGRVDACVVRNLTGSGYLLVSSQGDNTEESDGEHVLNARLGSKFRRGLLVVQDGANDPQVLAQDERELENISTNFKFVPWPRIARAFEKPLAIEPNAYHPRGH